MYMQVIKRLLLHALCCIAVAGPAAHARGFVYNLDVVGGLPSNHIYGMLVDRNGYLWMTTPEGVARYNGYEVKVFDVSDGLPTNDVWELFEDARGRIWLLSFAQSLGYIYNDRYKEAYIRDSSLRIIPATQTIRNYKGGVLLCNASPVPLQPDILLVEYNDTFHVYKNEGSSYMQLLEELSGVRRQPGIWWRWLRGTLSRSMRDSFERRCDEVYFFDRYVLCFTAGSRQVRVYDKDANSWKEILLDQPAGSIKKIGAQTGLYLLADTVFYRFNDTLGLTRKWRADVRGLPLASLSWLADGPPWGMCWGTAGKGVYLAYEKKESFQPVHGDVSEYRYVGYSLGGKHYWWNERLSQLAIADTAADHIYYKKYSGRKNIRKIVPWNNRFSLLVNNMEGLYLLDNDSDAIRDFLSGNELQRLLSDKHIDIPSLFRLEDFLLADTGNVYLISRLYGLTRIDLETRRAEFMMQQAGYPGYGTTYKGIVYDPLLQAVWAYGNAEAVICTPAGKNRKEHSAKIRNSFLNGIEQVLIDETYGNVFVKKADDLFMVNRYTGIITAVGRQISMHKSYVCLRDSFLVTAGRFGVAFFRIRGLNRLSGPVVYENIKDRYYSSLTTVQLNGDMLLINTNKGIIKCPIPDNRSFRKASLPPARDMWLIAKDNTGARPVRPGDTVQLDPEKLSLELDAVNPAGNGIPRYDYQLVETGAHWQKSGKNELVTPDLKPGRYYTLRIQVTDYVRRYYAWLHIYVVPHWWETAGMKRLMVAAGLLILFGLTWLTAGITKKIMRRENFKKNFRMEIELKSIYAQINPHFIYNTLNSILMLIRTGNNNDAFYNVSKFSKLLRAYIKSSRNRYITVAEEAENLKNYIELQQVRFNGKFNYRIRVEEPAELEQLKIPSLLLQPLVENAINHGLFHKEGAPGELDILFEKGTAPSEIICTIEDNGIGRRESEKINKSSTVKRESYGSILIKDLIDILNRYEQADIRIEYVDKEAPLTGTIVKLYIR